MTKEEKKIYVIKEKEGELTIEEWKKEVPPIMQCGHQAQSIWHSPKEFGHKQIWACPVCGGKESKIIQDSPVEFEGKFKCSYNCGSFAEWNKEKQTWILHLSSKGGWNETYNGNREVKRLPFLDIKRREFYCGCMGWE